MDRSEFVALVEKAIDTLPTEFKDRLDNVVVVVEDWPTEEQLRRLRARGLFGLYEGVPQTKRNIYYSALPDKITIFQKPIEQYALGEPQAIIRQVQQTVEHEIGHHFGLDEQEVKRREERKRNEPD